MTPEKNNNDIFNNLIEIIKELRSKCPWDKEQTILSIRHLTIEEVYELSDSILSENYVEIKKELGDLLMHILFYSRIAEEKNLFSLNDVIEEICNKLIRRHPHIYGDVKADTSDKVKENWEEIKKKEGNKRVLSGVPDGLPSMVKAYRIQEKAHAVGFDWNNREQVWEKIEEEMAEFKEELFQKPDNKDSEKQEDEFGDLFFALINFARFNNINPDTALEKSNRKFIQRFNGMEDELNKTGKNFKDMTLDEMEVLWEKVKSMEMK